MKNKVITKIILACLILMSVVFHPSNVMAASAQPKSWLNSITTGTVKVSAHVSLFSAELIASSAAQKELQKFRLGGNADTPFLYVDGSTESQELLEGQYYQDLTEHLTLELAKWYEYKIPASGGLFSQSNTFRVFAGADFLSGIVDGIDMSDVIGTMTYYVRVHTDQGRIHFVGINKMSLESYSGNNYFKHDLVENPATGPFEATTQVFDWSIVIPEQYRQ